MKILLGYSHYPHPIDVRARVETWLERLRRGGFDVDGFVLTLNPPAPALSWAKLDALWKRGDKGLLSLYEDLARRAEGYDVFVNCVGINLHPDFVGRLGTFSVYACFDDPESSEHLSRPVAAAYDLAMVGNIACLDMYRGWGVKNVAWWPIGFHPDDCDPSLSREQILSGRRDVDVALLCERMSDRRKERLDRFTAAFPQGAYHGRGWPGGFLPEERRVPLYLRTKIGPNFHNSIGPVNSRTFVLPANGVMQLCDNPATLGRIFEPEREVVGFDSIDEAIDRCRYYLAHDAERRAIAAAGWERAHRDYNEIAVFRRMTEEVSRLAGARAGDRRKGNRRALGAVGRRRWRARLRGVLGRGD